MIVRCRKPGRRSNAQANAHAAPPPMAAVVTTSIPGPRRREPGSIDPEVEAAVKASFTRNIRPAASYGMEHDQ
jgi:hypothetical protein